jgi:predicted TIM-barrel fold metal-dependent hydrolase
MASIVAEHRLAGPKAHGTHRIARTWPKSMLHEYFVIDTDRHVVEPPEVFTDYLEARYKQHAYQVVRDNVTGATRFLLEGRLYQKPAGHGQGRIDGMSQYRPHGEKLTYEETYKWVCGAGKLADMDEGGVDIGLWIPTGGLFIPDIVDLDIQAAYMRAMNNWFAEKFCADDPTRLWFAAGVPVDPREAAREARRAVTELGAHAIWMRPNIMHARYWWHPSWDQFWETLEALDVPLVFHEGTGSYHTTHDPSQKFTTYWMAHVASHPMEMTTALIGMVGTGILRRFPGLRVVFCEAGLSWFPYYLYRMDAHFESRRHEVELEMKPSAYFRRQCIVCTFEPEEALYGETLRWFGGKNVAPSPDYPHWDSSGLQVLRRYFTDFPDFTADERRDFLQNNACDFYGVVPESPAVGAASTARTS